MEQFKKKKNFSCQKQQAGAELKKKKKVTFWAKKTKCSKNELKWPKIGPKKKQNRPK